MKSSASELGLTVYIILVAMRNKTASYPKGNLANALYTTHNNIIFMPYPKFTCFIQVTSPCCVETEFQVPQSS